MQTNLKIAGIAIFSLFIKWVVIKWATSKMVNYFDWIINKLLGKYPEELAIWLHYRHKRAGLGHNYPNPLRCNDEGCIYVQPR